MLVALTPEVLRRVASFVEYGEMNAYRSVSRFACETGSSDEVWLELLACAFWKYSVESVRSSLGGTNAKGPANIGEEGTDSREALGYVQVSAPSSKLVRTCTWRLAFARWFSLACRLENSDLRLSQYRKFDAALFLSIANSWAIIEEWLVSTASSFGIETRRQIYSTLRGPARKDSLFFVPARSLRYSYSIHDGQQIPWDLATEGSEMNMNLRHALSENEQKSLYWGLFGGFSAYNFLIVTRFLQSKDILNAPIDSFQAEVHRAEKYPHYSFAHSFHGNRQFGINADDTEILIYQGRIVSTRAVDVDAVPPGPNAFARWFAEYARRLSAGIYKLGNIVPDDEASLGIVLFPDEPDNEICAEAITHNIAVRASAVYCASHQSGFAYSIRMKLIPSDKKNEQNPGSMYSAQLESRTWTITDIAANDTHQVQGQGVIGKFPVLMQGGYRDDYQISDLQSLPFRQAVRLGVRRPGTFVYQSFSGAMSDPDIGGTFEGFLSFVPNEILHPSGPKFSVRVPRFILRRPRYIF